MPIVHAPSAGKWSNPTTTGSRPPPCAYFSFTAVNSYQAVLFGGNGSAGYVNDCYLMNFNTMVCHRQYPIVEVYATPATLEMSAHTLWKDRTPNLKIIVYRTHSLYVCVLHLLS